MSFVDAKNQRGEVQAVPEHYLAAFPDQFQPIVPEPAESEPAATPVPTPPPAKAATSKES